MREYNRWRIEELKVVTTGTLTIVGKVGNDEHETEKRGVS